jgi:hypothetical protein
MALLSACSATGGSLLRAGFSNANTFALAKIGASERRDRDPDCAHIRGGGHLGA